MIITSKDLYVTLKQETALTPCLRGILYFSYITFFRRLLNLWLRLNLKTGVLLGNGFEKLQTVSNQISESTLALQRLRDVQK